LCQSFERRGSSWIGKIEFDLLLEPEEKVSIVIDMTDAIVSVFAEGIRAQYQDVTEEGLIERLRERFEWKKRWRE